MGNGWSKFKGLFWQPAEDEDDDDDGSDNDADDGNVAEALSALRDLEGVVGSIAVDAAGSVRASDLPRIFDRPTIELIGSKMVELRSVLTNDPREPVAGGLEFEGHSFYVRSFALGMVGVLFTNGAHTSALTLALNLVSRRVASSLAGEGVEA